MAGLSSGILADANGGKRLERSVYRGVPSTVGSIHRMVCGWRCLFPRPDRDLVDWHFRLAGRHRGYRSGRSIAFDPTGPRWPACRPGGAPALRRFPQSRRPQFGWMSPGKWWRALFRFNGRNVSFGRERPVSTPQPVALVGNRSPAGCCCRLDLSHFNPKATVPRDRGSASGELDSLSLQFKRSVAVSVEAERVPLRTDCEPVSLIGDALPRGSQA